MGQILTTIATHMLNRALALFAPAPSPEDVNDTWQTTLTACVAWTKEKNDLLAAWADDCEGFLGESEERYEAKREALADALAVGGKDACARLGTLEKSLRWKPRTIKAHQKTGFDLGVNNPECYVHVSKDALSQFDKLYTKVFRNNRPGAIRLVDCFSSIHHDEQKMRQFKVYVEDLKTAIKNLQTTSQQVSQTYGLSEAVHRVEALFYPVEGRICLPLPTVSMLDDLKTCVLMDSKVMYQVCGPAHLQPPNLTMPQVGRWFDGLGSHMIHSVKGHESQIYNWSDVIDHKLRSLSSMSDEGSLDSFVLSVSSSIHTQDFRGAQEKPLAGLRHHHVQGSYLGRARRRGRPAWLPTPPIKPRDRRVVEGTCDRRIL